MSFRIPARALLAATACTLAAALTGCGASEAPAAAAAPAVSTQPALTVSDPWVKAAEGGMTAVFGTVTAAGAGPVTITAAQTTASPRTELHEVVAEDDGSMTMRPKEGGFVVEPGTPHVLAPGGDHIMIMDLAAPIRPGDGVDVTLTLADGSTTTFTALAKETTAGEENYEHGAEAGMDMSGGQGG